MEAPAMVGVVELDIADRSAAKWYHFLVSAVAPRPIAWITSHPAAGGPVNLAPFSWFQAVSAEPPTLMVSISERSPGVPKDTARNILATSECVVHVVTRAVAQAMVDSSAPFASDVGEAAALNLETEPSHTVAVPRLLASPVAFECKLVGHQQFGSAVKTDVLFLEVVHVRVDDASLDERGNLDPSVDLLARLGGKQYTTSHPQVTLEPSPGSLKQALDRSGA